MSDINTIILNGNEYNVGGNGGGLTDDIKAALDQLAQKVAYIDEDGQDYYDALHSALYPPANLTSISCVYTQSGTVYSTTSLDSLRPDLVVTAHFDNGTTQTVTTYTLSGALSSSISMITVTYGGKTTTFNVTVTEVTLYPLPNGEYALSDQPTTISNDNHLVRTTNGNSRNCYIISTTIQTGAGRTTWFTIPQGSSFSITLKNFNVTNNSIADNYTKISFLPASTTINWDEPQTNEPSVKVIHETTGAITHTDVTVTGTASEDIAVASIGILDYRAIEYSLDIELRVDGVRYI